MLERVLVTVVNNVLIEGVKTISRQKESARVFCCTDQLYKNRFPECGQTYRGQVVIPRYHKPQGKQVAKSGIPSWNILVKKNQIPKLPSFREPHSVIQTNGHEQKQPSSSHNYHHEIRQ